jgi:ABC-type lipoprotein export system ATPase subunit
MIRVEGLAKSYRLGPLTEEVLRGVSFAVEAGERVALLGASGSGKSTLLQILALLDRPTAGSYELDGVETAKLDDERLSRLRASQVGVVFQRFELLEELTALENVGLRLVYRDLPPEQIEPAARAALAAVGLERHAGKRPGQMSGGQQQRVAIARALVGGPRLLLADEPTGSLDVETGREVFDLIVRRCDEERVAAIFATHDLDLARRCPRVLELVEGRIEERTGA